MLYLADEIDVALAPVIGRISRQIRQTLPEVCEISPSYCSVLVQAHSAPMDLDALGEEILNIARQCCAMEPDDQQKNGGKLIEEQQQAIMLQLI